MRIPQNNNLLALIVLSVAAISGRVTAQSAEASPRSAALTVAPDGRFSVSLEAPRGTTLFLDPGRPAVMRSVCVAPCRFSIFPGVYRFAVLNVDGTSLVARDTLRITGSGRVRATPINRRPARVFGGVLVGMFAVVAGVVWFPFTGTDQEPNVAAIVGVESLAVAGMISGAVMMTRRDHVAFDFRPGVHW